jgi:uncharacterized protein YceK
MVKALSSIVLSLVCISLFTGCGTVMGRAMPAIDGSSPPFGAYPYIATKLDYGVIVDKPIYPTPDDKYVAMGFLGCLPVDFLLDTACLPFDLIGWMFGCHMKGFQVWGK